MKRIVALLALILAPALSFAQTNVIQNEAGTTYAPNAGNINSNIAVDRALRQIVSLSAGTASATNPIKLSNSAYGGDGSAGIMGLAVRNDTLTTLASTNGGLIPFSVSSQGVQRVSVIQGGQIDGTGLLRLEDAVAASGDALVGVGAVVESALSADAAANDYGTLKTDEVGRLITTLAPAGETFAACSSSITGTVSSTIKAAVASNRNYITNITCRNDSAVPSTMIFTDGTGGANLAVGSVGATGSFQTTFPVPLRQTSNTAFTVVMGTTATATICCASGYISVN